MPDLHDLLTGAVPPVTPPFDEGDVGARVAAAERRRRRTAVSAMVAVVAAVALLISPALRRDQPAAVLTAPSGPTQLVPLSQWPTSVDFAGVEVEVRVVDEPDEVMQSRVAVGDGEAALNTAPGEGAVLQGVDQHRPRLWFGCGGQQVVRMVEVGRAADAPPFEIVGPHGGRLLPPGVLVEAAGQISAAQGCTPQAPAGSPAARSAGQSWLGPLAAAIDAAGLPTCCANSTSDRGVSDWGVLLPGGDPLSLSVSTPDAVHWQDTPARLAVLGDGLAVSHAIPNLASDYLTFQCAGTSMTAYPTSGQAPSVEAFVDLIGCTPEVHPDLRLTVALSQVLHDVGAEVVHSYPDPDVGRVTAILPVSRLELTSGPADRVGLAPGTTMDLNRGPQALDPAVDGFGAMAQCGVTHVIRATDETGAAVALDLAERIVGHPDCGLTAAMPSD